jgi:hypothetical protein
MFRITSAYEQEKFADILRHVEVENRRMDPMMTSPASKKNGLFQTISTALLHLVSFTIG